MAVKFFVGGIPIKTENKSVLFTENILFCHSSMHAACTPCFSLLIEVVTIFRTADLQEDIYRKVLGENNVPSSVITLTFSDLVNKYFTEYIEKEEINPSSYNRIKRLVLPHIARCNAEHIPDKDMKSLLLHLQEDPECTERTMYDAIRFTSGMYEYARKKFWLSQNPFKQINIKRERNKRKTYYSLRELKKLLTNPDNLEIAEDIFAIQKAIILSGARLNEVVQCHLTELDFDANIWTIPAARLKNQKQKKPEDRKDLMLPISFQLASLYRETLEKYGNKTHVFGSKKAVFSKQRWGLAETGSSSSRNYSNYIAIYREHYGIGHKTNHDFRRTIETTLCNLGVPNHITTSMTGHSRKGMDAIYNQAEQIHVLRTAFQMYADFIDFICEKPDTFAFAFDTQKPCKELKEIFETFNFNTYMRSTMDRWIN